MQYLGGKTRLAKRILAEVEKRRSGTFIDLFCGALSVSSRATGPRIANDLNEALIGMYWAWLDGWRPPSELSEEIYLELKKVQDPEDPLTAFAGFGCSFGGGWFAGYARNKRGDNFPKQAANSLNRKMSKCEGVEFFNLNYYDVPIPKGSIGFADPPYSLEGRPGFSGSGPSEYPTGPFDSPKFWRWATSQPVPILVSEYRAPEGWISVFDHEHKGDQLARGAQRDRLFIHQRWIETKTMAINLSAIFDDFDKADPTQTSGRSNGIGIEMAPTPVEIISVKLKDSAKSDKVFMIVEYSVPDKEGIDPERKYAWVHDLTNKWYGGPNAKQFVASAVGLDPKSPEAKAIDRTALEEAWGETQPLTGQTVLLETKSITTKAGTPFLVHEWSPGA